MFSLLVRGLLHQHLRGLPALALDVDAGRERVAADAHPVEIVILGRALLGVGLHFVDSRFHLAEIKEIIPTLSSGVSTYSPGWNIYNCVFGNLLERIKGSTWGCGWKSMNLFQALTKTVFVNS